MPPVAIPTVEDNVSGVRFAFVKRFDILCAVVAHRSWYGGDKIVKFDFAPLWAIRRWSATRWAAVAVVTSASGVFIGVPTGIIQTSFYTRMTPVLWWNYPIWAVTSVLSGFLAATYVRTATADAKEARLGAGGSVLSLLAVGCPVCNKLVVVALGASGAMNIWAPVQPILGFVSVGLLLWAFSRRARGELMCAVPTTG